jgi:adenine deaminase
VAVDDGEILGEIELPLFGLLADTDVWSMAEQRKDMLAIAEEMGCEVLEPYFFLTFITLSGFPKFAVSDMGYIDCISMELKDPVLGWND